MDGCAKCGSFAITAGDQLCLTCGYALADRLTAKRESQRRWRASHEGSVAAPGSWRGDWAAWGRLLESVGALQQAAHAYARARSHSPIAEMDRMLRRRADLALSWSEYGSGHREPLGNHSINRSREPLGEPTDEIVSEQGEPLREPLGTTQASQVGTKAPPYKGGQVPRPTLAGLEMAEV